MLRSLALFSEPEASVHTQSLADFITTTSGFKFSVHTGKGADGLKPQTHRLQQRSRCYRGLGT